MLHYRCQHKWWEVDMNKFEQNLTRVLKCHETEVNESNLQTAEVPVSVNCTDANFILF